MRNQSIWSKNQRNKYIDLFVKVIQDLKQSYKRVQVGVDVSRNFDSNQDKQVKEKFERRTSNLDMKALRFSAYQIQ